MLKERLTRAVREVVCEEGKPSDDEGELELAMDGFSLSTWGRGGGRATTRRGVARDARVARTDRPGRGGAERRFGAARRRARREPAPPLVQRLIELFQEPETNPHRAQLIFNSHDPTILGDSREHRLLGRDQTWFTEKRIDGSTRLFSLLDLDPRKHEAVGRRYLEGRYGATPILSRADFDRVGELIATDD